MGYICKTCGYQENFKALQDYRESGWEEIWVDSEGDVNDYGDREATNSDIVDEPYDLECGECNSGNVEYIEDEGEIEEIINEAIIEERYYRTPEENIPPPPKNGKELLGD